MRKVGLLIEGTIDEEILPCLLRGALEEILSCRNLATVFQVVFPPNGYGQIPKHLRLLTQLYRDDAERQRIGCDLFVVVHDSRGTDRIQKEVRCILESAVDFPAVYGLAIQEIEAWVLGDAVNVNRRVFKVHPQPKLPCSPEKDGDPKRTLNDLFVRVSTAIDYDSWNRECARLVAPHLRHSQVAFQCPKGFGSLLAGLRLRCKRLSGHIA